MAEWSYPDPAVDLTRRAAPAMGSGGAQDLPDRGPAIVYCSLYAAVRYVNEVVQADSEVRINMAAGVYHVGSKTLLPITRTPLFIYGASKRPHARAAVPRVRRGGQGRAQAPAVPAGHRGRVQSARGHGHELLEPGSPGWKSGTGVKYVLTTILRGSTGVGAFQRGCTELGAAPARRGGESVPGGLGVSRRRGGARRRRLRERYAGRGGGRLRFRGIRGRDNMDMLLLGAAGGLDQLSISRIKRLRAPEEKTALNAHNCDFKDNGAMYGGAIYVGTGLGNLTGCSFVGKCRAPL